MALLTASLEKGDLTSAIRLIHSLKGAAATLGIDNLAAMAKRLEERLRTSEASPQGDTIDTEIYDISRALTAIAAALPVPPAHSPPADTLPPDQKALGVVVNQLDALLAEHDTAAVSLFESHAAFLRTSLGETCEELARQIKKFEFEKARKTLRSILNW
jgi:HPt (histidine-containing phosphotransfer) domain-containing protein